jgi:hypothetical protein
MAFCKPHPDPFNTAYDNKLVQNPFKYSPPLTVSFQDLIFVLLLYILLAYRLSLCLLFPALVFYGAVCNSVVLNVVK